MSAPAELAVPADSVARLRVPPHSTEAEQSVLGALLLDNSAWDRVGDILLAEDFYRHEHRAIFEVMDGMISACKVADVITAGEALQSMGKLVEVGGLAYLNALAQSVPSASNVRHYAELVRERAMLRRLISLADETATAAFNPRGRSVQAIVDAAAQRMADLQRGNVRRMPQAAADLIVERLDHYSALANGEKAPGWSTGLGHLDKALSGGLRPGNVYVLAARPSVGKSSLALAILLAVAKDGRACGFLSQEMPRSEVMDRAIANLGCIDYETLQTGQFGETDWTSMSEATDALARLPLFIDDEPALTLAAIRSKAVALKREGLHVLAIDYLQLCEFQREKGQTDAAAIGEISKGIKALAKDLGIAVLLLSQLNRDVERRASPEPTLSDLRDSGAIEQDADVVLMLWRVRTFQASQVMGLGLPKNRQGKAGKRLAIEFRGQYQRWDESHADISPETGRGKTGKDFE